MKPARLIVLAIALVAGAIAAYLASGERRPVVQQPEAVQVLAAKADLPAAHVIGEADLDWRSWPTAAGYRNLVAQTERPEAIRQFTGAVVRAPIAAGEPIRNDMVSIVAQGMRPMAIELAPDAEDGGAFQPDERVDVLLARRDKVAEKASGVERLTSEEIVENARVLASVAGKSATIEVTPAQADTLAQSRQLGTLSLVPHAKERPSSVTVVRYGVSAQH